MFSLFCLFQRFYLIKIICYFLTPSSFTCTWYSIIFLLSSLLYQQLKSSTINLQVEEGHHLLMEALHQKLKKPVPKQIICDHHRISIYFWNIIDMFRQKKDSQVSSESTHDVTLHGPSIYIPCSFLWRRRVEDIG